MKKRVLILTDLSENAGVALKYALDFFVGQEADFYVLYIEPRSANKEIEYLSALKKTDFRAEKKLQILVKNFELCKRPEHRIFTLFESGSISEVVRHLVEKKEINYIFSTKTNGGGSGKLGKSAAEVITKVKCPTVLIPCDAEYQTIKNIAFPTDFNNWDKREISEVLKEILAFKKAHLHLLVADYHGREFNAFQKENLLFSKTFLDPKDCSYHSIENNEIQKEVQKNAEEYSIDLIAVVAKNLGYLQKMLFKSDELHLPFLILHK